MHECLRVCTQVCIYACLCVFCIFTLPSTTRTIVNRRGDTGHPSLDLKGKFLPLGPVFVIGVR